MKDANENAANCMHGQKREKIIKKRKKKKVKWYGNLAKNVCRCNVYIT